MKQSLLILMLVLSGCQTVRRDDVAAWKGAPLSDLETHPVYAAMPLEKRPLTNGSVLWIHTNKGSYTTETSCNKYGNRVSCSGGDNVTVQCSHQFIVKEATVQEYRPVGQCYTDCSRRPASHPCD